MKMKEKTFIKTATMQGNVMVSVNCTKQPFYSFSVLAKTAVRSKDSIVVCAYTFRRCGKETEALCRKKKETAFSITCSIPRQKCNEVLSVHHFKLGALTGNV